MIERISIELTNRCSKACWFCYNESRPSGASTWAVSDVVNFVEDCAANGVRAVSFGGGEPLEYDGVFDVIGRLRGTLFRSMTTNGLLLAGDRFEALVAAAPDKVHVSIHFAGRRAEVLRVIDQVSKLESRGIRSGVNLLVARSDLAQAEAAASELRDAGIGNDRIVYLPMRSSDTPTPAEVARVAGGTARFQSMTCLSGCAKSERFCSIGWDRMVAWCSYTRTRRALSSLSYAALEDALNNLGLEFCGGTNELVRLSRRPLDGHGLVRGRS